MKKVEIYFFALCLLDHNSTLFSYQHKTKMISNQRDNLAVYLNQTRGAFIEHHDGADLSKIQLSYPTYSTSALLTTLSCDEQNIQFDPSTHTPYLNPFLHYHSPSTFSVLQLTSNHQGLCWHAIYSSYVYTNYTQLYNTLSVDCRGGVWGVKSHVHDKQWPGGYDSSPTAPSWPLSLSLSQWD